MGVGEWFFDWDTRDILDFLPGFQRVAGSYTEGRGCWEGKRSWDVVSEDMFCLRRYFLCIRERIKVINFYLYFP